MWGWHDQSGWWVVLMMFGMLGFWALVGWVVVSVVRGPKPAPSSGVGQAERVLAERYAGGEIDDDEYRRRLDTLHRTGRDAATPSG